MEKMTIFVALRIYKYMESHKPLYLCIILCLIRLGASAKPISTENYLFHQLSISRVSGFFRLVKLSYQE